MTSLPSLDDLPGAELSAQIESSEHKLYALLASEKGNAAHSAWERLP